MNATAYSATVLDIRQGQLFGANGVKVGDSFYDVSFGDGYFEDSITAFTTQTDAEAASTALKEQVFLGEYFSQPERTNGCTAILYCSVFSPYLINPGAYGSNTFSTLSAGVNLINPISQSPGFFTLSNHPAGAFSNFTNAYGDVETIAVWRVASITTVVPEPEAYAFMLAGLGLLGFAARRRK